MADSCQNPTIQDRLSLIFPLILIRLAWDMKQISLKKMKVAHKLMLPVSLKATLNKVSLYFSLYQEKSSQ